MVTEGFQQVRGLTNRAFCFLKHVKQEAHLAEQTCFVKTGGCSMLQRKVSNQGSEVQHLKQRVGVGIRDVNL
jgi:hypothetical protein